MRGTAKSRDLSHNDTRATIITSPDCAAGFSLPLPPNDPWSSSPTVLHALLSSDKDSASDRSYRVQKWVGKLLVSSSEPALALVEEMLGIRTGDAEMTAPSLLCQGCGLEVTQLDFAGTHLLLGAEPMKKAGRAFECQNCKVVIFEDELTDGRFVPYFCAPSAEQPTITDTQWDRHLQRVGDGM